MRGEERGDLKAKELTCKICGSSFTFSIGEQEFYRDRQLMEPRRCPQCRRRRDTLVPDDSPRGVS